ncbi:fasciclin domain-containing protein [Neptuniibacter sp. PT34_22]|uniref:fasciclin domain-containing protein n=1 Tax=Neptuniibacter sp. PT34_22 TaxID=3398205 RepID=UPI0039F4D8B7
MKIIKTLACFLLAVPLMATAGSYEMKKDIVDVAAGNESFSTLVTALKAADLVGALQGDGPYTVFAPTNEAFAKLPEETLADLLKPENKKDLQAVLTYHVVAGKVDAKTAMGLSAAPSLQGENIAISVAGANVMINQATVVAADVDASNGIIHVIDTVILPPSLQQAAEINRMTEDNPTAAGANQQTFNMNWEKIQNPTLN